MNVNYIIEKLNLELITGRPDDLNEIKGVFIGDLLSLVMSRAKQGDLWITIQTHINVVAVTDLLEIGAVLVAENMEIEKDTIRKADDLGIIILKSNQSAYQLACQIHDLGL